MFASLLYRFLLLTPWCLARGTTRGIREDNMARSDRASSRLALAVLLASSAASAIEITTGTDDLILNINPQIQPRFEVDFDGPPGSASPSGHANFDFFIRRARLLVRGIAYKQFTFAILLNAARLGSAATTTPRSPCKTFTSGTSL